MSVAALAHWHVSYACCRSWLSLTILFWSPNRCFLWSMSSHADKILAGKLKPELVLQGLCKKSGKGCGDSTGAVRALKALAAQHSICEVTDVENLKKQYLPLLPGGSANSTAVVLGKYHYYDDDNSSRDCDFFCGDQCTKDAVLGCIDSCGSTIGDCQSVEDIHSIPSCIESAGRCFSEFTGVCCTCGCVYEAYCCNHCV